MTGKKLLLFTFLQWLLLALVKVWFFKYQIFSNPGTQQVVFWVLVLVIVTALVRRFNHISFLEAMFIVALWTIINVILDLLWVTPFVGVEVFLQQSYLVGVGCLAFAVMFFHKKRHLKVRQDLHDQHK